MKTHYIGDNKTDEANNFKYFDDAIITKTPAIIVKLFINDER